MTQEELEASIELAEWAGFSFWSIGEEQFLVFRSDRYPVGGWYMPELTELEAWRDAFKHGNVPRYAIDLNAVFALAKERGIGLSVQLYQDDGRASAYWWSQDDGYPMHHTGVISSPALAACRALIEALKEMKALKGDG